MNIIEQLKQNEKPFGLMLEEMQAKILTLDKADVQQYGTTQSWERITMAIEGYDDYETWTFRLRPDYAEDPDIVECCVNDFTEYCSFSYDGSDYPLHEAVTMADFLGFKYENDQDYIRPFVRMYRLKNSLGSDAVTRMYEKNIDKYEVLTPTHVLFQKRSK